MRHLGLYVSVMLMCPIHARVLLIDHSHPNSVDKASDGDLLLSGRHTDTIYKISTEDGSIVWRLGGKQSDFELGPGVKFSRQHDIRFRGMNKTHTMVSMLDNARARTGKPPRTATPVVSSLHCSPRRNL